MNSGICEDRTASSSSEVRIVRRREELPGLRGVWDELHVRRSIGDLNADFEQFSAILGAMPTQVQPFIPVLSDGQRPVAMLLGRLETGPFDLSIGYKSFPVHGITRATFVYGGDFVGSDENYAAALIGRAMTSLRDRTADVLFFNMIRRDGALARVLDRRVRGLARDPYPIRQVHWVMRQPATMDEFWARHSKKHRSNIESYARKLHKQFQGNVKLRCFSTLEEAPELLKDVETVAAKTYQRGLGVGFQDSEVTHSLVDLAARRGRLRSYVLYAGDQPAAFQMAFCHGDTFRLFGKGYDPAFENYRVGNQLFSRILEDLCLRGDVRVWDFGLGDAQYKQQYGTESWEEVTVYVFAPTFKGRLLSIAHRCTRVSCLLSTRLVQRVGKADRIKKAWRRRLRPSRNAPGTESTRPSGQNAAVDRESE